MRMNKKLYKAVDTFALAMKDKLREKELEGYDGWDDPECKEGIESALYVHVARQIDGSDQLVDIANLSMMLWHLQQGETNDVLAEN